ncbi:cell division protein FtsX [Sphingomonas rubra]|uniref:Cell division transport system permease protein n=1 Tax=Sphingomonas rubra TaxID=634430 RepID=A0A1I5TW72_9SPHN|nr:FtsX-like permease family protein [Sphingomonas rubra]SFP87305.1 cell division transport system permease protein [Sphingomonas rubra]
MRIGGRAAAGRVLDEAPGLRAMTAVMAIMMFLTVLAAALGLGTAAAGALIDRQLAGRLTVQVVEGDRARADAAAARVLAALRRSRDVVRATPVPRAELEQLLRPWLGSDAADAGLPVPAMIDVDLARGGSDAAVARVAAVATAASPAARVDRHARWMSPVGGLMRSLSWLAAGIVLLMAAATAAVVVLAARAGLEAHRGTIGVMHMLGATDVQLARLFQRRITADALIGGLAGTVAAMAVAAAVGRQLLTLGSELVGGVALAPADWIALALLPLGFALLATLAARWTVTRALGRTL